MGFERFDEKEAVKIAAQIEENGYRFYTILSERTKDKGAKEVLQRIAMDEQKHLKVLEKKFFPKAGLDDLITVEEVDLEGYLRKSGTGDIFTKRIDVERLMSLIDTTKKAVTVALDSERYSVRFFDGLAASTKDEAARKMYSELADEERDHVKQLEVLLVTAV